jgi:hypothetical protein
MRALVLALLLVAPACKRALTPEEQVRAAIAAAEKAAEEKDVRGVGQFVSERYSDGENDRPLVLGVVRLQFLRFPSIHLLVRVASVALPQPGEAHAVAFVAMAGLPIAGVDDLSRVSADLYRFELELADEGSKGPGKGPWRIRSARWARARAGDFF